MKRRYALLGMTVLLAAALAVPAFGGPTNPVADTFASAKKTSKKALTKAKQANRKAKDAKKAGNNALGAAKNAQGAASDANAAAGGAQTSANIADQKAAGAALGAAAANANATGAKTTADGAAAFNAAAATLIPVAVVSVVADGTLRGEAHRSPATGAPSVTHTAGDNPYDILVPGVDFSIPDGDAAQCNSSGANSAEVNSVDSVGTPNGARIRIYTAAGVITEQAFTCSLYDLG